MLIEHEEAKENMDSLQIDEDRKALDKSYLSPGTQTRYQQPKQVW